MKKILTVILVFLGLLTVGASIGANAASTTVSMSSFSAISSNIDGDTNVSYLAEKGGGTSAPAINNNEIRLYQNAAGTGGGTITITVASGYKLVGAKVGSSMATSVAYTLDDSTTKSSTESLTAGSRYEVTSISATSITFYCMGSNKNSRLYVNYLEATYETDDPSANYYEISFDSQNGSEVKVVTVKENELIQQQADPVKEGFIFTGWYDSAEGGNLVSFDGLTATANVTYYAHWETDPYNYATINSENLKTVTTGSGYAPYNGSHILMNTDNTSTEFSYTTNSVMVSSSNIQFKTSEGYLYNGTHVKGHIASIQVENLTSELTVYTSDSIITDPTGLTGTVLSSTNTVYKLPDGTAHTYFYIQASGSTPKVSAIKIQYLYDEAFAKYSVRFNAGKGVFKADKGQTLQELEGNSISGTLPTADDLEMTAYKYTTLTGWNDGTTTYEPGAEFTVSSLTVFNAVYAVPEKITVAQAKEIATLAGNTKSDFKFTCEGVVVSIEKTTTSQIQFTIKDLVGEDTIIVYNAKLGSTIYVGDHVAVTGNLMNYNGTTCEFADSSSYVVTDNFISSFVNSTTQKSLKAQYDGDLFPVDVDLRFGAKISLDAYREGAVYGVMAIDASSCAGFVSGATEYATADEFVAAHAGVKKVECTNRAVLEDGCQFAWVITDMEGHYKNYFTAVIYMEYEGVLYLGVSTVSSIAATATEYLNSTDPAIQATLTDEVKQVLQNIIDWE